MDKETLDKNNISNSSNNIAKKLTPEEIEKILIFLKENPEFVDTEWGQISMDALNRAVMEVKQ